MAEERPVLAVFVSGVCERMLDFNGVDTFDVPGVDPAAILELSPASTSILCSTKTFVRRRLFF